MKILKSAGMKTEGYEGISIKNHIYQRSDVIMQNSLWTDNRLYCRTEM